MRALKTSLIKTPSDIEQWSDSLSVTINQLLYKLFEQYCKSKFRISVDIKFVDITLPNGIFSHIFFYICFINSKFPNSAATWIGVNWIVLVSGLIQTKLFWMIFESRINVKKFLVATARCLTIWIGVLLMASFQKSWEIS